MSSVDMTPAQRAQAAAKARKEREAAATGSSPASTSKAVAAATPSPASLSAAGGIDASTRSTLSRIPLLRTKAGPRDGDKWISRLREEYSALIKYVENNKAADNDWFSISSDKTGVRWSGSCWYYHESLRYEFDLEFEIPVTNFVYQSWREKLQRCTGAERFASLSISCPYGIETFLDSVSLTLSL